MAERNPCIEAGCKAACCGNIFLKDKKSVIERAFPDAIQTKLEELPGNGDLACTGVYYADLKGEIIKDMALARIVGRCPNLGRDSNCQIYEHRPNACKNFALGSGTCLDLRSEYRKRSR